MAEDRSLRHYLTLTKRSWWLILLTALVVGGAAAGVSFLQGERYKSTATILYTPAVVPTPLTQDGGDPSRAVDTLVSLVQTDEVLSRALPATTYSTTEELRDNLDVGAGANNDLISISVSEPTAEGAPTATNAVAEAFLAWRAEKQNELIEARIAFLNDQLSALSGSTEAADLDAAADIRRQLTEAQAQLSTSSVDLTLVQPGEVPDAPYAPHPVRNGVIGFLLGLFLGVVMAIVRDRLDRRLRRVEEVEDLYSAPTLGVVPYVPRAAKGNRRAALGNFSSAEASGEGAFVAEAFRTIRTNLGLFSLPTGRLRVIVVSSAVPDEGKSAATANLAAAFAAAGKRTLAISADVHSPTLHLYFEGNGSAKGRPHYKLVAEGDGEESGGLGLIEVLSGASTLEAAAREISLNGAGGNGATLSLLASGKQYFDPAFLYQSAAMRELLADARQRYDVVVIDAPPLLVSGECSVIAREADALLLVAQIGRLTRDSARRASRIMEAAHVRPLGLIVVGRRLEDEEAYGYGYAYGSSN
jgi:receptor protein-tyrosine kinase